MIKHGFMNELIKALGYEYDKLNPTKIGERTALIQKLLGKTKNSFLIEPIYM